MDCVAEVMGLPRREKDWMQERRYMQRRSSHRQRSNEKAINNKRRRHCVAREDTSQDAGHRLRAQTCEFFVRVERVKRIGGGGWLGDDVHGNQKYSRKDRLTLRICRLLLPSVAVRKKVSNKQHLGQNRLTTSSSDASYDFILYSYLTHVVVRLYPICTVGISTVLALLVSSLSQCHGRCYVSQKNQQSTLWHRHQSHGLDQTSVMFHCCIHSTDASAL